MIIMKTDATEEDILRVVAEVEEGGLRAAVIRGEYQTVIGPVGDERKLDFDRLCTFSGVKEAERVEAPYKLISKEYARFFGVIRPPDSGDDPADVAFMDDLRRDNLQDFFYDVKRRENGGNLVSLMLASNQFDCEGVQIFDDAARSISVIGKSKFRAIISASDGS